MWRAHGTVAAGLVLLAALLSWTASWAADAETRDATLPEITVGVVYDGPRPDEEEALLPSHKSLVGKIREETRTLTRRDFLVRFPESKQLSGNWKLESIRSAIDRLVADPEVDLILSLGVVSTNEICRRPEHPKPVVAAFAVDIYTQSLPLKDGATGVENLNYLATAGSIFRDLKAFREIVGFSSLHVLVDRLIPESISDLRDYTADTDRRLGIETILIPVADSVEEALGALPSDAEAVYVTPLERLPLADFDRLLQGLIDRKLPTFSLMGHAEVERGVMAGLRSKTEMTRLTRRAALNIQRVLGGEDAGTLPVIVDQPERLLINMATARAVGQPLRWRILLEADLIRDEAERRGRILSLDDVVREAVDANLTLRARERGVQAGTEDVRRARSALRPQIEATVGGALIDEDRAEASFGSQAERTLTGGATVSQLLYSDGALANLRVSKSLQNALELERDALKLDIALEAATAFLDVLRAETLERVERDNLRLTQENLGLARERLQVGYSGPADVYRWESELATDRSAVISAFNRVQAARAVLNRLLHRPLEEPFEAEPPTLEEPELLSGYGRLGSYLDTREGIAEFREFMVEEGLRNSPELQATDAAIEAQERARLAARRSFWSPVIALQGQVERDIHRGGAGSGPLFLPGSLDQADRDDWSVALSAALPLFTGGERTALLRQTTEDLARLRVERDALEESIELRIRAAMFDAGSTFPSIELAQEASVAASKNLDLVTDAYSRGVVSIIDLLDAQNAALVADEFAANAVFDFLSDLMELQRAADSFGFFMSGSEREAWFQRLHDFFVRSGVRIDRPR
jgi:outer membrane protein TolC